MSDDPNEPEPTELPSTEAASTSTGGHEQIGPYRLLQKLGEGGMGEVWLAEQTEPIKRKVALKIIKQGMDTKQVVARFEAERQALAMMDHASVAKVFDAGTTPHGRPYFVMEYVKGVPITEHCDRHRLSNRERLGLFREVCEGVKHAHQKAIIHRDLKPSNVLVTEQDGKRLPKIIDFGVAKATAQKLTEKTMFTELGVLIGTPEYMSPEQAELTGEDVDTRTDVYSLGVILYELLVGALPFDPKELRIGGLEGIRKKIREEEPHKPSTRVSTLGEAATDSARARRVDQPTLQRELWGDLDWITMRALEKDRSRRYGSPNELAADIGRYLADEPVLASPPSVAYRAGKFIHRHRFGVLAAAAGVVMLIAFAATMAVQANRIASERDRAEQANADLVSVLESMNNLAMMSGAQGNFGEAEPFLLETLEMRKRVLGDDHPDTLDSMNNLAVLYWDQGRYGKAESLHFETLETRKRVLGKDHPDTLHSMNNLAVLYWDQRRYDEAEPLYLAVLQNLKRVPGDDDPAILRARNNLASLYWNQGRYAEAEPLYLETLETRKRMLGNDHPSTLHSMNNLAILYSIQGRYDEAEPLFLETLETRKHVFGNHHPRTATTLYNLACVEAMRGDWGNAMGWLRESVEAGYAKADGMSRDSSLESLHGPEFDALVEQVRQNAAAQLGD